MNPNDVIYAQDVNSGDYVMIINGGTSVPVPGTPEHEAGLVAAILLGKVGKVMIHGKTKFLWDIERQDWIRF